jgi:plastocyanin
MHQQISKKVIGLAMSVAMVANVVALPVLAETTTNRTSTPKRPETRPAENFCTRLENASTKLDSAMADKSKKLDEQNTANAGKLEKSRSDRDEKTTQQQTDADKKLANRFAQMQGKAKNDAQKAALDKFQAAMTAAINARKAAFDSARTTFRTGVDAAMAARKAGMQTAATAFQTALKDAEAKAKSDCAGGVAPATARATFQASVKAAREKFAADRKAVEKLTANLKTLAATRKAALTKARADFKAAVEKATKDLKAALAAAKPPKPTSPTSTLKIRAEEKVEIKTEEPVKEVKVEEKQEERAKVLQASAKIAGFVFQPVSVSVSKGGTVTWTNNDSSPHTVTAADGSFDSGNMAPGATYSHTFTSVGTFSYVCSYHSSMNGSVVVTE